jgi:glycosyltransferase involved in cell wall biosynthesis
MEAKVKRVSVVLPSSCSIVVINKNERAVTDTLSALENISHPNLTEIVVIDASGGALNDIREEHQSIRWIDYTPPDNVRVSIPHQRNVGVGVAKGDIIVFIDATCTPGPTWFRDLVEPIISGREVVTCGPVDYTGTIYRELSGDRVYLDECPTINVAFSRTVLQAVGGFDEAFRYGSDIDLSWRVRDLGFLIRWVATAGISHHWGGQRRQAKRSFAYGAARADLYRKHPRRLLQAWRTDPLILVYPLFLLGLPISLFFPIYPLLLLLPLLRARHRPHPIMLIVDHLLYGAGALWRVSRISKRC